MKRQITAQAIVPTALLAAAVVATSVPLSTPPIAEEVRAHHAVALATDVLMLEGTRHRFSYSTPVQDALQGYLCRGEFTCRTVDYPASRSIFSKPLGVEALNEELQAATNPVVVVGYDQGASVAIALLTARYNGELPYSNVQESYVLIGNPHRNHDGHGGIFKLNEEEFDNPFQTIEVFREYDGYADFPDNAFNLLAVANAFAGMSVLHRHYEDVDVNSAENLVYYDDETTHLLVPTEHLPLLQVWYDLGLGFAVEWVEPALKAIIDSAYDRSMYQTQTPPEDDQLQEADSLTTRSSTVPEEPAAIDEEVQEQTPETVVPAQSANDTSARYAISPEANSLQPSEPDAAAEALADEEQEAGQSPADDSANKLELEQDVAEPGDGNGERESQRRTTEPQAEPGGSNEAEETSGGEAPSSDDSST